MKKILDLLEQKVQWIALALGVAYVLYMAWSYLLSPPVKVSVANEENVPPGDVDSKVLVIAEQLEAKINATQVPAEMPQPQQYVADFKAELGYGGKLPEQNLNANIYHVSGRVKLGNIPNLPELPMPGPGGIAIAPSQPGGAIAGDGGPAVPDGPLPGPVEKLPTLATPNITHTLTGLSNVNPTPNPNNQAAAVVVGVDKSWVTIRFEVDLDSLARQWDGLRLPNNVSTTSFLQVTLTRQEQQSDGSWGKETVIPTLPIHSGPAFPAAGPPNAGHFEYIKWASGRTQDIVQPGFFPVLKGDPWYIPGEQAPALAPVAGFNVAQWVEKTPQEIEKAGLTIEQRRLISAEKERVRREQNRGRGGGGGRAPAPRGGAAPPIDLAVIDPDRPVSYQPVDIDAPIDNIDLPATPQPGAGGPAPAARGVAVGAGQGKFQIPVGEFDPRKWGADHSGKPVIGWAHDATAVAGATYRYKVSYAMKNPVFGNKLAVKQASLMEQMSIRSTDSEWSEPVDVVSPVSFFVTGSPRDATSTVPIDIFRLQGGEPHRKTVQVGVGDPIGGRDGSVDYTTGWTLIDFSKDPRPTSPEWHILLMDSRGTVRRRLLTEDQKDPRYLRLKEQAGMPAAAAAR